MGEAAEDRSEAASSADRNPLQAHEQTQVAGVEAGAGVHRLERAGGAERRTGHDGVGDPCRHRADEQERYAHGAHRVGDLSGVTAHVSISGKSQYSQGNTAGCTCMSLEAALQLFREVPPSPRLVDDVVVAAAKIYFKVCANDAA